MDLFHGVRKTSNGFPAQSLLSEGLQGMNKSELIQAIKGDKLDGVFLLHVRVGFLS